MYAKHFCMIIPRTNRIESKYIFAVQRGGKTCAVIVETILATQQQQHSKSNNNKTQNQQAKIGFISRISLFIYIFTANDIKST